MKYLITGGSGYIGSRLTDLLVEHDDTEVVNLDIRPPAVPRSRTRFVQMDIRDRGMRGADRSASAPTRSSTSPSCSTRSATSTRCTTST